MKSAKNISSDKKSKGPAVEKDGPFPHLEKDGPFPHREAESRLTEMHNLPPAELCLAQYTATLIPVPDSGDEVMLQATGVHPTSGYEVYFQKAQIDVYPPQFSLWHVRPSGPALDVITPFSKFTSFKVTGSVETLKVFDSKGQHDVRVQKLGSGALKMCE